MQKSGVKMPEQKKRRPKSHLINSKEKLSKCVCSSSLFVSSITSSLVKSKTDSAKIIMPLTFINPVAPPFQPNLKTSSSSTSQILFEKNQKHQMTMNSISVFKRKENFYLKNDEKSDTCNQKAKFLTFKVLRESLKSIIDSNSEKSCFNHMLKTNKKQNFENRNQENCSKFSNLRLNKKLPLADK
jgi:hypothetical protein